MASVLRSHSDEGFPEEFQCLLSYEIMTDPVMTLNGNTYERVAIEEWINRNGTCPMTREPLSISDLRPNRTLRDMIESARRKRAEDIAAAAASKQSESKSSESKLQMDEGDEAKLQVTTRGVEGEDWCLVTIQCPEGSQVKTPVDICVVIDTSGSMCSEAKAQSSSGMAESHGLSILDIVKHATTTIIESLGKDDRLAIVAYSSKARSVLPLTIMHDGGKALAKSALSALQPSGSTNLWDGLKMGMDLLSADSNPKRLTACFVMTDGCPNIEPPRGHLPMLRRYKDSHAPGFSCTINTYGFGYSLDSTLLDELAREGHGSYSFIPDPNFVGTVFGNSLANLCTTMAKKVRLTLEPMGSGASLQMERVSASGNDDDDDDDAVIGKRRAGTLGGYPCTRASWGWSIDLGTLRYGQEKNLVIRIRAPDCSGPSVRATLSYEHVGASKALSISAANSASGSSAGSASASASANVYTIEQESGLPTDLNNFENDLTFHKCRLEVVDTIYAAHVAYKKGDAETAVAIMQTLSASLRGDAMLSSQKRGRGLIKDITGQVTEALSKAEFYQKWGQHYLPSLAGAHLLQLCYNFKDPGVQFYGGTLFSTLQTHIDDLFNSLPPPTPSRRVVTSSARGGSSSSSSSSSAAAAPRLQSMASYNCRSAPCFPGHSLARTVDGGVRRLDSLRPGDLVLTGDGKQLVSIDAVVRTQCEDGRQELVTLNESGLQSTPWHPIRLGDVWTFPSDLVEEGRASKKIVPCNAVYSIMLTKGHSSMLIDGVECITLGHDIIGDKVASHNFYGTNLVRLNIKDLTLNDNGVVELQGGACVQRSRETGLVCQLYQTKSV